MVAEIKPIGIGAAATTEIERTITGTIPSRTAGSTETTRTGRMGMAMAATVTAAAGKNFKSTARAMSTPLRRSPRPPPRPLRLPQPVAAVAVVAKVMAAAVAGGGNGDGGGGNGEGGGNDAGNAGSGLFDSPLATKARRRANDFDNADREDDDHRIIVDADPDGESVYGTDSISFTTGPDGLEIQTGNISYTAQPTPTPEPLPRLELPTREPGFPFGEDFPFGNTTVAVGPTSPEPSDSGDTGTAPAPRAEPIPASNEPVPVNSDGGDNTMDFSS